MLKSGLAYLLVFLLTALCWFGQATPIAAQPTALPLETAPIDMASKSLFSFSGKRPTDLGIKDGKLAVCPGSPNCVSSQAPATDAEHAIAAIAYTTSPSEAMTSLKSVIQGMERSEIIEESGNYLYAEFTSALMGYVDDVEFYLDENQKVIHVRSASRLGKSDLGVNRKRVEAIREQLQSLKV